MKISVNQSEGVSTIKIEGDLVVSGVADAKAQILGASKLDGDVCLDLGSVAECDTAGMQLLLMIRTSVDRRGNKVVAVSQSEAFVAALQRLGILAGCFGK